MNYNTTVYCMNCPWTWIVDYILHKISHIKYILHMILVMHRFFYHISTYTKNKTFETWSLLEVFSYSWIVMLNWKVSSYCTTGFRTADILNYFKSIRVRPFHSFVWVFKLSLINCSEARFYGASGSGLKLGSWNWQIASCSPTNSELFFLKQFINNFVVMVLLLVQYISCM